jgi:ribonuclease P protein component
MHAGAPAPQRLSFPRSERLKHKKAIAALFSGADGFFAYPLRVQFALLPHPTPELKVAFTVSRRKFRRAVDRNHLRRQMREAWRHQSPSLREAVLAHSCGIHLMLLYTGRPEDADHANIYAAVKKITTRLMGLLDRP